METRSQSEAYAELGMGLIRDEDLLSHIRESDATIVFLSSDLEKRAKGRAVLAECEKVPARYRWAVPCDFTVTVYEPNVERLDPDQLRILILHELLHVGIDRDGNEERYSIIPHDVEEFREILDRYGARWAE